MKMGKMILIIDQEKIIQEITIRLLEDLNLGYELCPIFKSPQELFDFIIGKKDQIVLIILGDLSDDFLSFDTLLTKINQTESLKKIPILVYSFYDEHLLEIEKYSLIIRYLSKDTSDDVFKKTIKEMI